MKKIISFNVMIFLLLFSCKSPEKKELHSNNAAINSLTENLTEESAQETYLVRDSLVIVWEKKLLEFTKISNFKSEKAAVQNLHDHSIMDTLITYSQNNCKIEVYKAQHFEAVKTAHIETPDFRLNEYLHVGAKKLVLENDLGQGLSEASIKVGNEEGTTVFTFTLKDARIQSITFEGYVD